MIAGWLFRPAPAARLAWFRVLVGLYALGWLIARLPAHLALIDRLSERWHPVGVLSWLDSAPPDVVILAITVAGPPLALAFTAGRAYRAVAPAFFACLLVTTTLDSSWGQTFHTENLLVLHVLVLALAPAADALVPGRRSAAPADDGAYGWPLRLAALVLVTTYVVSGLAKLRLTGWAWADGDVLRHLVAHDNLRKAVLGDVHSPLGTWLVGHGWVFTPLALGTLVVELGAPAALLGGRWRTAWMAAAWSFHVGVLAIMAVLFPYPLTGMAFAPLLTLERLRRQTANTPWARRSTPPTTATAATARASQSVVRAR